MIQNINMVIRFYLCFWFIDRLPGLKTRKASDGTLLFVDNPPDDAFEILSNSVRASELRKASIWPCLSTFCRFCFEHSLNWDVPTADLVFLKEYKQKISRKLNIMGCCCWFTLWWEKTRRDVIWSWGIWMWERSRASRCTLWRTCRTLLSD